MSLTSTVIIDEELRSNYFRSMNELVFCDFSRDCNVKSKKVFPDHLIIIGLHISIYHATLPFMVNHWLITVIRLDLANALQKLFMAATSCLSLSPFADTSSSFRALRYLLRLFSTIRNDAKYEQ